MGCNHFSEYLQEANVDKVNLNELQACGIRGLSIKLRFLSQLVLPRPSVGNRGLHNDR